MAFYIVANHEKRFVAFFNPRCGSSTIQRWFYHSLGLSLSERLPKRKTLRPHRITPRQASELADYTRVLFLRDPHQRLVSFYCHWVVRSASHDWCFADKSRNVPLLDRSFSELVHTLRDLAREGEPFQHHLVPQTLGVQAESLDHIVLVEEFAAEIEQLNAELGISGYESERRNARRHEESLQAPVFDRRPRWLRANGTPYWRYFYDREHFDLVDGIYREDVQIYLRCLQQRQVERWLPDC